jgi:hypothetical protein
MQVFHVYNALTFNFKFHIREDFKLLGYDAV